MRNWLGGAALAACLVAGVPAQAQMIDAADASKLAAAMQKMGWQAKLSKDPDGDPLISSKISRSDYTIQFYGCAGGDKCKSVLFSASYDVKKKMTAGQANDWNRKTRFGSLTIDSDGDPRLTLPVNMVSGISTANFEDTIDYWRLAVVDLEKLIDW